MASVTDRSEATDARSELLLMFLRDAVVVFTLTSAGYIIFATSHVVTTRQSWLYAAAAIVCHALSIREAYHVFSLRKKLAPLGGARTLIYHDMLADMIMMTVYFTVGIVFSMLLFLS